MTVRTVMIISGLVLLASIAAIAYAKGIVS